MLANEVTIQEAEFSNLSDEELVYMIQKNDNKDASDFLLKKYRNLARAKSRAYFIVGAEREDLFQEGLIGLYKAMRDYKTNKQASFKSFADLCITRQIITAIKTATRQKHSPLNNYISLNKPVYEDQSERTLLDVLVGPKITNPEELIIDREEFLNIERHLVNILSRFEWQVLTAYLEGFKYQDIAIELNKPVKSVDNALQRVKKKVEAYLKDRANNDQ